MIAPAVVAHRGASRSRAEHTLAAYALAIEEGADGVECDVRLTRDGHLVCVHDSRLDRTSTARGRVSATPLDVLAAHDFGTWHDPGLESADDLIARRTTAPPDPAWRGVLTLAALLELIVDTPRPVTLFVETKHPVRYGPMVEAALVAALARFGLARPPSPAESRVVVMSFSSLAVRRVRVDAPQVPTVLLLDRLPAPMRSGWLPPWADVTGPGVHVLRADPGYVDRARGRGHDTYCWTVDDPADVAFCAGLGVQWLATNTPAAARRALAAAGRREPPPRR